MWLMLSHIAILKSSPSHVAKNAGPIPAEAQLRNTFDQVFSPVEDVSGFSGISCRVRRQEMPLEPDTGHVPDLLSMNRIV